ncbi:Low temperature viability protein [Pseudovirgaria hyperparasitica]|uniref:Low temperature viability protein n=1 Tax=Pseudovirgaria hyperparasitica TaxID=470096 RepID=A0A6A6W3L2_9PEZI|nr:Low temperature viability protein [Pseudovirgaria hyperparasitica]KAF2756177.1 Low temperature viability protein [Pseudovirgaria hyperparasitica]
MPRRRFIDKKNATTFQLLHRAQNDPLIHDSDASQFVFHEVQAPTATKSVSYPSSSAASHVSQSSSASRRANATLNDLGSEFGDVRANEGEAAEYGIYYDDSSYDYMQHMRDLGSGQGTTVWVEAPGATKKGKQKQSLEDAISEAADSQSLASGMSSASHAASDLFNPANLPSEFVKKTTYQDQQNIPDAIAGFQPDMDPRLREVLEALEDEEYVDEAEEGDFFEDLTGAGIAVDEEAWRDGLFSDEAHDDITFEEDAGWETDDTIKPDKEHHETPAPPVSEPAGDATGVPLPAPDQAPADREDTDWQGEFAKFKASGKAPRAAKDAHLPDHLQAGSIMTGASSLLSGRKKKRKGALTGTSGYSMSSSILARTEALSVLDSRFERIEEDYANDGNEGMPDDDGASLRSGMTGMSRMSRMSGISTMSGASVMREDFDSLLDDFLGGHSTQGKSGRRVKKGKQQSGMEQLDEVRQGLGPVRLGKPQQAA